MTTERGALSLQQPRDLVELIEAAVLDVHRALAVAIIDRDLEADRIGEPLLQRHGVGALAIARLRLAALAVRLAAIARQVLDLAHVEPALDDLLRELIGVGLTDQHAGMAGG